MTDSTNNPFQEPTGTPPADPQNPFATKLGGILNDQGQPKYKDVDAALDALTHSQAHIAKIEADNATALEQLAQAKIEIEKRKSVEDVVNSMTQPPVVPPVETTPQVDNLSEEKVANLIKDALTQQSQTSVAEQNLNSVVDQLSEKFGENVKQAVAKVASDLNMSANDLQKLSETNPSAVLRLFNNVDVKSQEQPQQPSTIPNRNFQPPSEVKPSENSLIQGGASNQDIVDHWKQHGAHVHKELGVET